MRIRKLAAATAVAAVTVVVVVAAATVTTVLTAASATVMLGLQLLGRGIAHQLHVAGIAHGLASQLMVEVHGHLVVGHLGHDALDTHALLGHHGHDGTHADVLVVKLAVNMENLLLELIHQARVLGTESLLGLEGEVKLLALLQAHDMVLETLDERHVHAEDKGIGLLLLELEHTDLLLAVHDEDFIYEFHVFSCFNFLH